MRDYKELSRIEFNKVAEKFDNASSFDIYKMCQDSYEPIIEEVLREHYDSLLDVGCGTGNSIQFLQTQRPDSSYTGIDIAEKMIECAVAKGLDNTEFLVGDAENLPFDDNTFDVIICKESFHHYPNAESFFASAYRVLRPGGRLIILDMTMFAVGRWFDNNILFRFISMGDAHVYSLKEVKSHYENAGFTVVRNDKLPKMRFLSSGKKL